MAATEERVRTKKYLRNANGIKVGDKFRYVSKGFIDGGHIISKGAEYDATVIQVTDHLIVMSIWCDQSTLNRPCILCSLPYNWSIRKVDVGRSEKLYLYA